MSGSFRKRGKRSRRKGRTERSIRVCSKKREKVSVNRKTIEILDSASSQTILLETFPSPTVIYRRLTLADWKEKYPENLHYFVVFDQRFPFHKGSVINRGDLKKLSLTLVRSADILTDTPTLNLRVRRIENFNDQKVRVIRAPVTVPDSDNDSYDSDATVLISY